MFHLKWPMWNKQQDNLCLSGCSFFVASSMLGSKNYVLVVYFIVFSIASPLKWGKLDQFLSSNVTHHSIGTKPHDRTLIYVRFSIHSTACHTTVLKVLPTFAVHIHIWWQVITAKCEHTDSYISSTDKDSAQCNRMCVCGIHLWLWEVTWLNYTPAGTYLK
jgi:hypothetical protein